MLDITTVLVLVAALVLFQAGRKRLNRLPLPPGPPRLPLVGNAREMPSDEPWIWYGTELLEKYGDIVYLSVVGQPMIILNSLEAIKDLFVKRGPVYSDRPIAVLAGEIMGADQSTTLAAYGDYWKTHRRMWHQYFGPNTTQSFAGGVHREAIAFVSRIWKDDKDTYSQLRLYVIKALMKSAMGMEIHSLNDQFIVDADAETHDFMDAIVPGRYLVNIIPILKYVPTWFPGAGWKRKALSSAKRTQRFINDPYDAAKKAVQNGTAYPSFVTQLIENPIADEMAQKQASATAYGGGMDTTRAIVCRFVVAMMLYPDVQARAQKEIDEVTGGQRLPTFDDQPSLPYIDALIRELMRWNLIAPLGIAHRLIEDDEYRGYRIPKGSIVIPNLWAISKDKSIYPDPENFVPERFLTKDGPPPLDPRTYAFGVGRRICPGQHFAELSLYTLVVTLLATSTISKPLDEKGHEKEPHIKFVGNTLVEVEPFEVSVRPRSEAAATLLSQSMEAEAA